MTQREPSLRDQRKALRTVDRSDFNVVVKQRDEARAEVERLRRVMAARDEQQLSDAAVMRAYAELVEAGWLPPKRNGAVDDVWRAIELALAMWTKRRPAGTVGTRP